MSKYREAKLSQAKGGGMVTASCPACLDRDRRGGQTTFKSSDSQGRNTWMERHKNHHVPKKAEYGVKP